MAWCKAALFILLYFTLATSTGQNADHHEIHGCYSGRIFPNCSVGEKMAILDMNYGVKTPSSFCLPDKVETATQDESCCSFKTGDCLINITDYDTIHKYYASFSGYTIPLYQPTVDWRRIEVSDNCTAGRTFSNFISIIYQCIPDKKIISMATTDSLVSSGYVSTMYPIIGGDHALKNCTCTVTSSQPGLNVSALDIRLECYTGYENTTCTGNHTLTFTDGKQTKQLFSEIDTVLGEYQPIFITNESSMTFTFLRDNGTRPQMVWFGVQSNTAAATITILCNGAEAPAAGKPGGGTTNTSTGKDKESDSLPIIIGVTCGVAVVVLVIIIVVCRWYRNRSAEAEEKALAAYRRKISQQNSDVQTRHVRQNDQSKQKHQQQNLRKEQREESVQSNIDQPRRKKLNKNPLKGLEMSMNDPVYHDVTIPSKGPKQAEDKH